MGSLHLYLPDNEIEGIKKHAQEEGISVSEYIRKQLHLSNEKVFDVLKIVNDVKFLRRGLEAHWKEKAPSIYEAALNNTALPSEVTASSSR